MMVDVLPINLPQRPYITGIISQRIKLLQQKHLLKNTESSHSESNSKTTKEGTEAFSSFLKRFRILAYASEIGESFRPLVPRSFVRFLYGVSWGFVITDTGFNTYLACDYGYDAAKYMCIDKSKR